MKIIKPDLILDGYNRFNDSNHDLRINRNIYAPDIAIKKIQEDPELADLLEKNIKPVTVSSENVLNPRMFFALRNAETGTNRVEFYCMGANYLDLTYMRSSNDYVIDYHSTYKEKEKCKRITEIQNVFVINQKKYEKFFGSFFYSLNPLCMTQKKIDNNVFLIDAESGFTRRGRSERCFMDFVFLVVNEGIANLLFIESKRAGNKENERKQEIGNHSETIKQIYEYGRLLEKNMNNVLEQFNYIISFYNGFGCELPLLDKTKSRIKLGLCVFRQNTIVDENRSNNVMNEAKVLGCLTRDVLINEASYAQENIIDSHFEERAIDCILEMAKDFTK